MSVTHTHTHTHTSPTHRIQAQLHPVALAYTQSRSNRAIQPQLYFVTITNQKF